MQIRSMIIAGALATASVLATGQALAFVPWINPNGTAATFSWANGGSRDGLFGSPTLVGGDTFVFFPSGFRAQSTNGGSVIVGDRLEFDLFAAPGFQVSGIRINEYGDYGVVGAGSSVSAAGSLIATNLDTGATLFNALVTNPASPITSGFGNWSGTESLDFVGWTRLHVIIDNDLIAISGANGAAYIEKKVFASGFSITLVPTPGTAALLGLGSLAAIRRRR